MIEIIQKNYCFCSSFFVKENHLREDFTATVVGHILKQNLIRNDTVRRHCCLLYNMPLSANLCKRAYEPS